MRARPAWIDEEPVRAIQGNQNTEHPHNLLFFDTETYNVDTGPDSVDAVLQFGCAERVTFNRGHWSAPTPFTFDTVEGFWDVVESQTRTGATLWVFAHNVGGFDVSVVGGYSPLVERGWEVQKAILNCPPFVVDLRKGRAGIRLIDSLNYSRMALASIGKYVGVPKTVDPGPDAPREERIAYCRNDVAVLRAFVCGLVDFCLEHDLGVFGITMASIAMHAWRHRFAPKHRTRKGKEVCRVFPTVDAQSQFERQAYMAGRTEMFTHGPVDEPVWCYDANSMFPAVMRANKFPWALKKSGQSMTLEVARRCLDQGFGLIAEVEVDTDENWYPLKGERIIYRTGKFKTWLCTPEIDLALRHNHITAIHQWQAYEMEDLFSTYVDEFYQLRRRYEEEGNQLYAMLCKVGMLNSLYGKFGQKIPEWEDVTGTDEATLVSEKVTGVISYQIDDGPTVKYRRYGGRVERLLPDERETARGAFVAIAAHVTSYARVQLLEGMLIAGRENVHYCDTDSLHVNAVGRRRLEASGLIDQHELGKWKLEKTGESAFYHGAKDYIFDGERIIKGVRRTAVEVAPNTFRQAKFRSFRGALHHHTTGRMIITQETKHLCREYRKGIIGPDGRVRPYSDSEPPP